MNNKLMWAAHPPSRGQAGFSLVEVLVSTVILSIGLIGVAGLQAASLQNNQGAFMRSQATALAYDLADRMRSNVAGANGSFYDIDNRAVTAGCETTAGCSPQQMAEHDLAEWWGAINTYLPLGEGVSCIDSTPNDGANSANPACDGTGTRMAVKVWWDDDRDGAIAADNTERLVITYQL